MEVAEGTLTWEPADRHPELLAAPVARALIDLPSARVAPIDPELADTSAFCEAYGSALDHSANCVVVAGKRAGETRYASVVVLATMRADINKVVRRQLDVRRISFAPMDDAVRLTGMEYGGITPIGLPHDWPVLVDSAVVAAGTVVIGSGLRASKLLIEAEQLTTVAMVQVMDLAY